MDTVELKHGTRFSVAGVETSDGTPVVFTVRGIDTDKEMYGYFSTTIRGESR